MLPLLVSHSFFHNIQSWRAINTRGSIRLKDLVRTRLAGGHRKTVIINFSKIIALKIQQCTARTKDTIRDLERIGVPWEWQDDRLRWWMVLWGPCAMRLWIRFISRSWFTWRKKEEEVTRQPKRKSHSLIQPPTTFHQHHHVASPKPSSLGLGDDYFVFPLLPVPLLHLKRG